MRLTLLTISIITFIGFGCSGGERSNNDGGGASNTGGGTTGGGTGGGADNPIDEEIVTLETGGSASEQTLFFEASGAKSASRQLTEFLLIVRASEESCIKLKFSPDNSEDCLLYTSPSPRDRTRSRMPSSA